MSAIRRTTRVSGNAAALVMLVTLGAAGYGRIEPLQAALVSTAEVQNASTTEVFDNRARTRRASTFITRRQDARYGRRAPFLRLYVGVGLGGRWQRAAADPLDPDRVLREPWATNIVGLVGADVMPRMSVELQSIGRDGERTDGERLEGDQLNAASVLLKLGRRSNLNRRIGISAHLRAGYFTAELAGADDESWLWGAGLEAGFRNGIALRADAVRYGETRRSYDLSLVYRFGRLRGKAPTLGVGSDQPLLQVQNTETGSETLNQPSVAASHQDELETPSTGDWAEPTREIASTKASGMNPQHYSLRSLAEVAGEAGDADADGVLDYFDRCPDTPSGAVVTAHGCHAVETQLDQLYFASGSAELSESAFSALKRLADQARRQPQAPVHLSAYTDSSGSVRANRRLAGRRADVVSNMLAQQGIQTERLRVQLIAERQPQASNATAEGRALNRRVMVYVSPAGSSEAP